jgi:predicted transcriptional regulator
MSNVTLSKAEYRKLKQQADAYKKITKRIFESVIRAPLEEVIEDFRQTKLYTDDFLEDLEEGLSKSSYAKTKK